MDRDQADLTSYLTTLLPTGRQPRQGRNRLMALGGGTAAGCDQDITRHLTLLRTLIRDRGFTQLAVQDQLGWGRSYISQLMTNAKSLRFDQVLDILNVIGVSSEDFFIELYQIGGVATAPAMAPEVRAELDRMKALILGTLSVLEKRGVVEAADLAAEFARCREGRDEP